MGAVPARGHLGVDESPVNDYLEDPTAGADELDLRSRMMLSEGVRQTGGARFVVSSPAVLDGDVHFYLLVEPVLTRSYAEGCRGSRHAHSLRAMRN